jgi:two-component system, OmpR family, alkaline phosphatase synthesis response regulator PhoP
MDILVVDDEAPIRELIGYNIRKEGWHVLEAADGTQAVALALAHFPSLIVLDLMLSDMSGLDVCRILKSDARTARIPIVMVTARTEDADIVSGLELGADDYVIKPFSPRVLIARIRSVLRRAAAVTVNTLTEGNTNSGDAEDDIKIHTLSISVKRHEIRVLNELVEFSATEFAILLFLARHVGQVFSRQQIINAVKGDSYPVTDRSIDVQILGIRRKIGDSAESKTPIIETLRGVGYRMTDPAESDA